jgi:pimeloyl-ACP methyl ester carboxylesterase
VSPAEGRPAPPLFRRFVRWSVIGGATAAVLAYLTVIGYLMANEVELVFVPNRKTYPMASDVAARIERIVLTKPGRAPGLLWVMRQPQRPDAPWVLYLHGNGANLATPENVERYQVLQRLGLQVVAPEYPGFGEVSGTPSEAALEAAARDAWTWLREQGVSASSIAIYGWSLGSGVATDLASAVDERAVVLEGAFSGVDDRASELYPWLPIRLMVRNRFASRERIARLGSPLLLLHATDDTVIPVSHARLLLAAAREPRRLVELTGGHVHLNRRDQARYTQALQAFFTGVFASAAPPVIPD